MEVLQHCHFKMRQNKAGFCGSSQDRKTMDMDRVAKWQIQTNADKISIGQAM